MFHYALPSPGLESPLAMYEYLENECVTSKPWVEQVDYRLPFPSKPAPIKARASSRPTGKGLPSLAQISARMSAKQLSGTQEAAAAPRRLPSFLQQKQQPDADAQQPERKASPPPLNVGRLRMPGTRSPSPPAPEVKVERVYSAPISPKSPELQVTTTLVPRTVSTTRNLTERNLEALLRQNVIKSLRRQSTTGDKAVIQGKKEGDERLRRRHSAPAELPKRERTEFKHQVLNHRAGF